jgi:putative aldouronate transport system permease protein
MPGRNILMGLFIFTMYFSGGLIPGYLNVRSFGLLNTRTIMLIGGLLSVYNMIVCRTFFASTIPWELHEASQIDGASDFTIFYRIILPLSKPVMAVMALYYGVGHWNSYFGAMIYLRDRDKFPLQLFLREILIQSKLMANAIAEVVDAEAVLAMIALQDTANILKYCIIVAATAPMLILYPFLQKYFEKGILIGSIKG